MSDDHVYGVDKIEEHNNTPPIWLVIFGICLLSWGAYYLTSNWSFDDRDSKKYEVVNAEIVPFEKISQEELIVQGKEVFENNCASCHNLGSLSGDKIKHSKTPKQFSQAISMGIPDKGMPPFGDILSKQEMDSLLTYIKESK